MSDSDIIVAIVILGAIFYFYSSYSRNNNTPKQKYQEAFKKFRKEYIDTKSGKLKRDLDEAVYFAEQVLFSGSDIEIPKTSYEAEVKKYIIVSSVAKIEQFAKLHSGRIITDEERQANEQVIYFCSDLIKELFNSKDLHFLACEQLTLNLIKAGTNSGCNIDYNRVGVKFNSISEMASEITNSFQNIK